MGDSVINQPFVSICIPVYYSGPGVPRVLDELLTSIEMQDYPAKTALVSIQDCEAAPKQELEEVVSGRVMMTFSPDPSVANGPATNTNSAMMLANPDGYIKLMNQDDFFESPTALSDMVSALEDNDARWLVSACVHTDSAGEKREHIHVPSWPGKKGMVEGVNRFGCPSVAMFEAELAPACDPNLLLCMDCDMWIQMVRKAGLPLIHRKPDVIIRMWDEQLSNQIDYARALETDKIYLRKKYGYS